MNSFPHTIYEVARTGDPLLMVMKRWILLAAFCMFIVDVSAQYTMAPQVLTNCGGQGAGPNYKMEWTLGEFVTASLGNSQFHLTQGFHQPFLVSFTGPVGINEVGPAQGGTTLYPNPAQDELFVRFSEAPRSPVTVTITGVDGKLLRTITAGASQSVLAIPIGDLAAGSYLASIHTAPGARLATHRFLKTN